MKLGLPRPRSVNAAEIKLRAERRLGELSRQLPKAPDPTVRGGPGRGKKTRPNTGHVSKSDGKDPLSFVVSKNMHRRHLDEGQRAAVAARIAKLKRGGQSNGSIGPSTKTAARMMNVSSKSVKRARKVLEKGIPELAAAVEAGEVSVSAAADVADLSAEEQRKDPLSFVVSKNMHRRQLTESQRAMVAAKIATLRHGGDRKSKAHMCALKQDDAARQLKVSRRSVQNAKKATP